MLNDQTLVLVGLRILLCMLFMVSMFYVLKETNVLLTVVFLDKDNETKTNIT